MQQMKDEEDRAIASYARRKSQEEESLRLAMQLQAPRQTIQRKRVVVSLPANVQAGQVLRVQVPGHGLLSVQVPQDATPGQALEFYVSPPQQMDTKKVRVVL